MRSGILSHSFSSALRLYQALADIPGEEVFIILVPSPQRSAAVSKLINLVRIALTSLTGLDRKPLRLLSTRKVIFLPRPLHDQQSIHTLKNLKLDVGLHNAGVIYREATIDAFRLGILNHHIGILPAYRGRSVMEWSILQGDPTGVTVFFIDAGIDTGRRILISEPVDVSAFTSIADAKRYLFDLDKVFFRRALDLLRDNPSFQLNDGSGRRYFVMSKLFAGVVEQLLEAKEVSS